MKRHIDPPLLLTVPEAANAIRLSENTLRGWVEEGRIPVVRWRPGSHPLIPMAALLSFVAAHTSAGAGSEALGITTPSAVPSAGTPAPA